MFFQAVKFLLACIFLENESIFHFFFFFCKGHSVPTARLSLDRTSTAYNIKADLLLHITLSESQGR